MQDIQSGDDLPPGERKWSCDYCTYGNWPSAAKCTMCRASRPVRVIQGQDIYSLDTLHNQPTSPGQNIYCLDRLSLCSPDPDLGTGLGVGGGGCRDSGGKWACPACTYYNYARAVRCTQCLTPRKRASPALSRQASHRNSPGSPRTSPLPSSPLPLSAHSITTVNRANAIRSLADQLQPLHISTSGAGGGKTPTTTTSSTGPSINYQIHSPGESSKGPSSAAAVNTCIPHSSQQQKQFSQQQCTADQLSPPGKWSCFVCTYENWPRAGNCVLCGSRRGRSSPDQQLQQQKHIATARDSPSPEGASMRKSDSFHLDNIASTDNRLQQQKQQQPSRTNLPQSSPQHPSSPASAGVETSGDGGGVGGNNDLQQSGPSSGGGGGGGGGGAVGSNNLEYEKRLRQLRRRMRETDWTWVSACMGVVEGDACPVEAYLNSGGDPTRKLTHAEAALLARPGVYEPGHTLVHLAVKLHREDLLATLLSQMEGLTSTAVKRVPSYVAPDLAAAIRRQLSLSLRHRKGSFPCFYLSDCATYTLPPEIEDLPRNIQDQLYNEVLDQDAKSELETELCINWSDEICCVLGSRLFPLWNRSAGDCLLDAALQATWGVFDRDNMLRQAIADSLTEAGHVFYPRWKEWESRQAQELHFSLAENQWAADWADLLSLAGQPGASLEQTHIFALAHVLRRPIIVYGVKYVKSWRGENLGYAKFEGVYLPLLWDPGFCYRSPIALGYTRGHFCALVPPEPDGRGSGCGGGAGGGAAPPPPSSALRCSYLPLVGRDGGSLPLHFLSRGELGREEEILRQWLDIGVTESGLMVAQQTISRPPLLVAQMTEEWLNYYRKIAQSNCTVLPGRNPLTARIQLESEEESTDDD